MRARTPRIIQMEATECGAASLGIVLGYYGKYVPLEELRLVCGVSRDGSNALKVIQAAQNYGLIAKAYKKELEDLREIKVPAILFWRFNHFLVLEGISKKKVYLNDPAAGPRTTTMEELDEGYTGIAITFEKGPNFQTSPKPPLFFYDVVNRVKSAGSSLTYLAIMGLLLVLPGLAFPAFTRIFVDEFLLASHYNWEFNFIMAIFVTMVLAGILTSLRQYALNRLNIKLSFSFSSRFLWHLLRLPVAFYTQRFSGEIAYRMNFNDTVTQSLTGPLATTILDFIVTLFYLFVLFLYDVTIGMMAICALFLNLGFMRLIQNAREDAYARLQQEFGKSVGYAVGAIQQIETIKASGYESSLFSKLAGYLVRSSNATQEIGKKDALLVNVPVLFQALTTAGLLALGGWRVVEGKLTVGMLMALYLLLLSFLQPVSRFVNFGQMIQNVSIQLARLNDVLKNPIDPSYKKSKVSKEKAKLETLEFQSVAFGYTPGDPPLIVDLNFSLAPGKRIALVGPSGCGKSTIAKLACALYPAWSGKVLYNGLLFQEIDADVFENSLGWVDQEILLFEGTIWENLTLWDHTITEEMLIHAAKDAMIHEVILSRHHLGYHAPLIEGGRNLSGGQRQLLEIARALVKNPSLLIMDEATSALDSETEKQISDNIRRRGCACLMIAHRLSTIQDCDEIIVLEKGKVVARGSHQELKKQPGIYRDLVESEKAK